MIFIITLSAEIGKAKDTEHYYSPKQMSQICAINFMLASFEHSDYDSRITHIKEYEYGL